MGDTRDRLSELREQLLEWKDYDAATLAIVDEKLRAIDVGARNANYQQSLKDGVQSALDAFEAETGGELSAPEKQAVIDAVDADLA